MGGSNCEALSMGKRNRKGDMRKLHDVEGQLRGGKPECDVGCFMGSELEPMRRNHWEHHVGRI